MNYLAAFQDFFKSPKWTMNLLFGAICCLIPVVGPMVLTGWLLGGFWGRSDDRAETFPDFVFDKFGKYLERGLWPGLLWLIAFLVIVPVLVVVTVMAAIVAGSTSGSSFVVGMFIKILVLAVFGALSFLLVPMVLRSGLMQDFAAGFNAPFIKRFINLTKSELGMTVLLLAAAIFVTSIVWNVLCIGQLLTVAASPIIAFAWMHLSKQLYALYLSRGGEPLVISPKVTDETSVPPEAPLPPEPPLPPAA